MRHKQESTLDALVRQLREAKPSSWDAISKATKVPKATIRHIAYRETKNPRHQTMEALLGYFSK